MMQLELKQSDLVNAMGGKNSASEVLNRKQLYEAKFEEVQSAFVIKLRWTGKIFEP